MKKLFAILLLTSSYAIADEWTNENTYTQAIFITLHAIDYGQTMHMVKNPDKFREKSLAWVIGEHPSRHDVNVYFSTVAIGHTLISYYLPDKWRKAFQYVTIIDKSIAVTNNYMIGCKIDF